jgi:EmrB/QacA subfamily drug resistance transporter
MRKWMPLVAVGLGTFMLLVDVTIVNVALPSIASDLKTELSDLQWVIDIYALALAALLLGIGSAADRFGHRLVYLGGMAIFALSSLACALANGADQLILARGIQGIGGAAMFTTTITLLNSAYSGRDKGVAFGVWGAINGAAAAAGPILGGLLSDQFGWPSIFLVNVPVSVVALVLAMRMLKETKSAQAKIDLPGIATFTVLAGALTYGLIQGPKDGWDEPLVLAAFAVAGVMLIVFLLIEQNRRFPMLDLSLFRWPAFTGLMIGAAALQAAAFSAMTYTSLWLQSVLGLGPIAAGAVFLPLSLVSLVVSILTGRLLHDKIQDGLTVGVGVAFVGVGCALEAAVGATSSWTVLVPGSVLIGIGVGLAMPTLSSAVLGAVPPERSGMASGAVTTFRQLGYVVAVAVFGVVFSNRLDSSVDASDAVPDGSPASGLLAGGHAQVVVHAAPPAHRNAIETMAHTAFASGLRGVFVTGAAVALLGALLTLFLTRARRAHGKHEQSSRPGTELALVPELTFAELRLKSPR